MGVHSRLKTSICSKFGVEVPIFNAPMSEEAGPELAAAVCTAGGLGLLGHGVTDLDEMRSQIRDVRARTSSPFGVGLLFPATDGRPAEASAGLTKAAGALPTFLHHLIGPDPLPTQVSNRRKLIELAEQRLDLAIEERVPVLACGLGSPAHAVQRAKAAGMLVISLVGSVAAALEVEARGVDAVIAQGHEAGGHTGRTSTFVLVPAIVDAVSIPVIAAGGISDGRGLAAALMLGAQGVLIGTRLLATPEARTAESHKQRIVRMRDDETLISRCYTGKPARVLRNAFTDAWRGHEAEILPMPAQMDLVRPLVEPAKRKGSIDVGNWPTGQAAMLVDRIAPAAEVIAEIVEQAAGLLGGRREVPAALASR